MLFGSLWKVVISNLYAHWFPERARDRAGRARDRPKQARDHAAIQSGHPW